ncbi:hypothetical protein [Humibacter sp.]|uniref:hypothetical protein n=1 Tax=Humibacter sp. TaxID=1940291 RepID=UPI003F80A853
MTEQSVLGKTGNDQQQEPEPFREAMLRPTEALVRQAQAELSRLCAGRHGMTESGLAGKDWTMSVPVNGRDSDVIFASVIERCAQLDVTLTESRAWLANADDQLSTVQRVADEHLRGKIKGAKRDATITLPLTDLLLITCAAASAQQDVRAAVSPPLPLNGEEQMAAELSTLEASAFAILQQRAEECCAPTDAEATP